MSQLRESRRASGPKYFLEVPESSLRSRPYTVDDITETRETGMHQQWSVDSETRDRLRRVVNRPPDPAGKSVPSRDGMKLAIAITLIAGGLYGFWLLWASL